MRKGFFNTRYCLAFLILPALTFHLNVIAQQRVSKYPDGVEMKKGVWFTSLNLSAGKKEAENDNQLLYYAIDQEKKNMQIRLDPGYVIKQNLAAGAGILYGFNREYSTRNASDGKIFTGKFVLDIANPLNSTKFGVPFTGRPWASPYPTPIPRVPPIAAGMARFCRKVIPVTYTYCWSTGKTIQLPVWPLAGFEAELRRQL